MCKICWGGEDKYGGGGCMEREEVEGDMVGGVDWSAEQISELNRRQRFEFMFKLFLIVMFNTGHGKC